MPLQPGELEDWKQGETSSLALFPVHTQTGHEEIFASGVVSEPPPLPQRYIMTMNNFPDICARTPIIHQNIAKYG